MKERVVREVRAPPPPPRGGGGVPNGVLSPYVSPYDSNNM